MKKPLTIILIIIITLSIIGTIDSGYLTIEKLSGVVVPCSGAFDCDTVLSSKWAYIGSVPLSMFGFGYYLTVLLVSIGTLMSLYMLAISDDVGKAWRGLVNGLGFNRLFGYKDDSSKNPLNYFTAPEFLMIITTFGFIFSIYLVSIMAFVLEAWCKYCLVSAGTSASLFIMMILFWIVKSRNLKTSSLSVKTSSSDNQTGSPIFMKAVTMGVVGGLYKLIVKPICFRTDAEVVHNNVTHFGRILGSFWITKFLSGLVFSFSDPRLGKTLDGVYFPNPVGLSAGFDYNADLTDILPAAGLGWHTIGTVTLDYYEGNKKPRLGRFPNSKALLVNKGLKSTGAKAIVKKLTDIQEKNKKAGLVVDDKKSRNYGEGKISTIPVSISIASTNRCFDSEKEQIENMEKCFRLFEKSRLNFELYELNISCPNTHGGEPFTTPGKLERLLKVTDNLKLKKPMYIKMPIDQSEKETLALLKVIEKHKVAGLNFGNLTKDKKNPDVLPEDARAWGEQRGNLSGKPTWNRSTNLVRLARDHYPDRFTIVGTGGIFTGQDAQEKLNAGADLVQLITGMVFGGPQVVGGMNGWLVRGGCDRLIIR